MTRGRRCVLWVLLLGLVLADAACHPLATQGSPPLPGQPAWCRALPRPEYKPLERVRVSDPWFEVYQIGRAHV